jgi:hypothetical protein
VNLTKNLLPIDAICDLHDNSREDKADNVQLDRDRTNFLHRTPTGAKEIRSKQRRKPTGHSLDGDARERARPMRAFIVPNGCGPAPQSDNMQKGGNRDMGKGSMSKSSNKMKHSSKSSMKKDQ